MPRKPMKTALYFFMKDVQTEYREGGKTLPMKEIASIAVPRFKALSFEEKLFYQKMEQDYKKLRKEFNIDRYSSDGIPLTLLFSLEEEKQRNEKILIRKVENFVFDNASEILDTSIYVMVFNVLVVTREDEFFPNELAVIEYSLTKGIKASYHVIIDPGKVPIGYFAVAKKHAEDSHNFPLSMSEFTEATVENEYGKILNEIFAITNATTKETIVFTHESHMEQTKGCFRWLLENAKKPRIPDNNIVFADIAQLVINLYSLIGSPLSTRTTADDILLQNMFDYEINSRCVFHEDLDSRYCALGFARKMCFILSDSFCKLYHLKLTNAHLPIRNSEIVAEEPVLNPNTPKLYIQSKISQEGDQEIENNIEADDKELSDPEELGAVANAVVDDNQDLTLPSSLLIDQDEVRAYPSKLIG